MKVLVIQSWPRPKAVFCVISVFVAMIVMQVAGLSGSNVCMVQQKYNITKRVKYRAPMSVRTYEWCFSIPPRCSRWKTEMRDLTRLETEERMAEVAVCCPGYKMKDVSCIPICPDGKTGTRCTEECPPNKWGPNCVHECVKCLKGFCSPTTGLCDCLEGWQGESCNVRMTTMSPPGLMEEILTTTKSTIQTSPSFSTKQANHTFMTDNITTRKSTQPLMPSNIPISLSSTTNIYKTTEPTTRTFSFKKEFSKNRNMTLYNINKTEEGKINSKATNTQLYNRTESSVEGTSISLPTEHVSTTTMKIPLTTKSLSTQRPLATISEFPLTSTIQSRTSQSLSSITNQLPSTENIRKSEITLNSNLTAIKIKQKEIWIKPTQKGISTEFKIKLNHDLSHPSVNGTKSDIIPEITTPRTIIVSIIPTSVSHILFKKIAFTTASYLPTKTNATLKKVSTGDTDRIDPGYTKSMSMETSTQAPFTIKILSPSQRNISSTFQNKNITKPILKYTSRKMILNPPNISTSLTKVVFTTPTLAVKTTNSMSSTPTTSTVKKLLKTSYAITLRPATNITPKITTKRTFNYKHETNYLKDAIFKTQGSSLKTTTTTSIADNVTTQMKTKSHANQRITISPKNITKTLSKTMSTEYPPEDETFHILTEPEHITAVMSEKERERNSLDLVSVVSVAGGIMMTVITVAVIIVMFERCRRPRYDDGRKVNDMRMQVMIDNDVPPPYVRSIFHTPLPDPPQLEKCHYQPISTLDRNLKQFMRPVVVQNISPIMLENFRGILECHYDHLPRRSLEVGVSERLSLAPSLIYNETLQSQRTLSIAESTIEAIKCEAKLNSIENENPEPLYAEIPCWRPPSEHAIGIINLNGEAVTEL